MFRFSIHNILLPSFLCLYQRNVYNLHLLLFLTSEGKDVNKCIVVDNDSLSQINASQNFRCHGDHDVLIWPLFFVKLIREKNADPIFYFVNRSISEKKFF